MKRIFFILAGIAFALVSCRNDDPVKLRQSAVKKLYKSGTVKIAVANSFEDNKTLMWESALLAQEKINDSGILNASLELVKCEDGGTPVSGTKKAYEIASDNQICAVIGHGYSDISVPCSMIYQYYGLLTFNYISTVHKLTGRKNPLIFSNMPDDNNYGDAIAKICERKKFKRVLIYNLENTSGTSLSDAFEFSCSNIGINVVNRERFDISTSNAEIEMSVKRWKSDFVFDAVFIAGRMPVLHNIITIMRDNGVNCPIIGADPFDDPLLTKNLPASENERIFAVSNYNISSQNVHFKDFFDAFKAKYGVEPDQEALQVYDALFVLAKAISLAKTPVPSKVAAVMHENIWDEAAGPYSFDEEGSVKNRQLTVKVFKDGKFEEYNFPDD